MSINNMTIDERIELAKKTAEQREATMLKYEKEALIRTREREKRNKENKNSF